MILGLSFFAFTALHVIISLIGIAAGAVVVHAMLRSENDGGWTATFLAATVLTTLTGFLFPITVFTPRWGSESYRPSPSRLRSARRPGAYTSQ